VAQRYAIVPFFIPHEGCPFNCIFCDQRRISGFLQVPLPSEIEEKIREAVSRSPSVVPEVAFYGGSFTGLDAALQQKLLEPAFAAYREGLIRGIRVSTRPDLIDEKALAFLAERGVKTIELGVQSLSREVLLASGRNYTVPQAERAVRLIKQWGFALGIQLMLGLPRDTWERSLATAETVAFWQPDFVRLYPTVVVKNTPLADLYFGSRYKPLSLEEAVTWTANLYILFAQHHVPVIRMGLHPSETLLKPGEVVAGPFHPAFGELANSRIARWQLEALFARCGLEKMPEQGANAPLRVALLVNPRWLSPTVGYKKENVVYFSERWGIDIRVQSDNSVGYRDYTVRREEKQKILEFSFTWKEFLSSRRIK